MKTPAAIGRAVGLLLLAVAGGVTLAQAAAPTRRGGATPLSGRGVPAGVTNAINQATDALGNTSQTAVADTVINTVTDVTKQTAKPNPVTKSSSEQSNSFESNTFLTTINKAFDTDSDSIDPETGTMKWKGHSYSLGETRLFRSRFEQYLALSPAEDEQAYQVALDHIMALLATNNTGDMNEASRQAWQALYAAAEFSADGGYALSIANQVFDTWRIEHEKEAQRVAGAELERLRKLGESNLARNLNYNLTQSMRQGFDITNDLKTAAELFTLPVQQAASSAGRGGSSTTTSGGSDSPGGGITNRPTTARIKDNTNYSKAGVDAGSLVLQARQQASLEIAIKSQQAAQALSGTQAKLQFQSQILNLFLQRRFQHALIASSFYRVIFKGSAQEIDGKYREALSDFLPTSSNIPFYIGTIENLSREAINQAKQGMAAVRSNLDAGMLMAATERLQETFFLGEYTGDVIELEKSKREKILVFYGKVGEARKLADLKDYDAIIKLNSEIGDLAKDFRSAEVSSAARNAKTQSQLFLAGSQQAAAMGDIDRAGSLLEKASMVWPLNPEIATYGNGVAAGASLSSQAAGIFDDAYQHTEYRRIYERRNELAVGLAADAKRGPQFKAVIERMGKVELALAQAQEAANQNSFAVAWDTLAAAAELVPNDSTVNQRKAELAPRVADYVGLGDKARLAEERGDETSSLTHYLAVQDINPASPTARQGIERVTKRLLARLADEAISSAPEKK